MDSELSNATEHFMNPYIQYWAWLDKKLGDSESPVALLQKRTMNTVCAVLMQLADIPFSDLSYSLYFFCADIEMREFARLYESQIELAGADPDKFARGLHKFYNEISAKIKKNNMYADFFDFIAICARMRNEISDPDININVINCYYSLLLQNLEYLRPNKFDFSVVLCGMRTSGELLTMPDCYPYLDVPAHRTEKEIRSGKVNSMEKLVDVMTREYKRAGYSEVRTAEDVERLESINKVFTNHVAAILPFINEYTFDILPKSYYNGYEYPLRLVHVDIPTDELVEMLRHRNRTLPSNGAVFKFTDPDLFRELLLKECMYNDRIYMLYRLDTVYGDLSGYYDTRDGFLFSVLSDANEPAPYQNVKALLLYMYASAVTARGPKMQQEMGENCWLRHPKAEARVIAPLVAEVFGMGGKLRSVLDQDDEAERHALRKNSDKYKEEERAIQGFIRKLGKGQNASATAIEYAQSLGYELAPDETYVRPFIRRVLRLKEAKDAQGGAAQG